MHGVGGVLGISYQKASEINREKLFAALSHLRYTAEGSQAVLNSLLESETKETGFTFNGTTENLNAFQEALGSDSGVEIEVVAPPPTPEMAEKLRNLFKQ